MEEKAVERVLKALANRRRIAIVTFLKKERRATVGRISSRINLSFRATSKHLGILSSVGILDREQKSLEVYYFLNANIPLIAKALIKMF